MQKNKIKIWEVIWFQLHAGLEHNPQSEAS